MHLLLKQRHGRPHTPSRATAAGCAFVAALTLFSAHAQQPREAAIMADGTVRIPAFEIPYSSFGTEQARLAFIGSGHSSKAPALSDMPAVRAFYAGLAARGATKLRAHYPVEVQDSRIGGVPVRIVRSTTAEHNDGRVLLCLHGGSFMWGELVEAEMESIAIASSSGIDVIGVDYREAPEHPFPAAIEDVLAVYTTLLKSHAPKSIGIYGGSAGAIITGETVASLINRDLPIPGAIGLFNGGIADMAGDSMYWANPLTGQPPLTRQDNDALSHNPYFKGADMHSFLVLPASDPGRLKGFPPALLLSGSRDFALSSVLYSERLLAAAGVPTELHVWDGLSHASFGHPELPETQEMIRFTAGFFQNHLVASPAHIGGK